MIIKDFNSFKIENPNETVLSVKQLLNKGVIVDISKIKQYYNINQFTKMCFDLTTKPLKKFHIANNEYKVYKLETKGDWYNKWFGVIILENNNPKYAIQVFELDKISFDERRYLLTLVGRQEIVTIYFDNGEIKRTKF